MEVVKVDPVNSLTASSSFRLDVEYVIHANNMSRVNQREQFENLVQVDWVQSVEIDKDRFLYCEIGDIDRWGRVCPYKLNRNAITNDPEEEKQVKRRWTKIDKGVIGKVSKWTVLVPKTRPYRRVFALVTGEENVFYTTDLLVFRPRKNFRSYLENNRDWPAGEKVLYAHGCVLLWLLLKKGPLGDALAAISRWGKSYPTLDLNDVKNMLVDTGTIQCWIEESGVIKEVPRIYSVFNETAKFYKT